MAQQKPVVKKTTKPKLGGEIGRPPFDKKSPVTYLPGRKATNVPKSKNGSSLGMKSVKAGFDKNPGVTRADIITAATKKAKKGATVKKAQMGSFVTNEFAAKNRAFPASPKPKSTSNTKLLDSSIKKGKAINAYQGKKGMVAKSGASMKKCKYGCK